MTEIKVPPAPTGVSKTQGTFKPSDYNSDLANIEMVKDMMAKLPTPTVVTKKFTVFQGMVKALKHDPVTNPTYIDLSLLSVVLDEVSRQSVNVDGFNIKNFWAYMMHPTFIIQGSPMAQQQTQEQEQGFIGRAWGRITGRGQQESAPK